MYNYTVSQISKFIKDIIDNEPVLENITVQGEVSSFSVVRNNAYFKIKDKDCELNCIMFSPNQVVQVGEQVLVTGSVKYYAKMGKISFTAYDIQLNGQGNLYLKFLQMKEKLEKMGYFETSHKKSKPDKISRVGVVTSATGAVIHDIHKVIKRRNPQMDIVLYDVKVQGEGAELEIARGIEFFSNYDKVDAVIVARGGGSLEDLSPFNSEVVATATYNCNKFIISAVGHETDITIIDLVADLRAATPSVAGELVSLDMFDVKSKVTRTLHLIESNFIGKLNLANYDFRMSIRGIQSNLETKISHIKNELSLKVSNLNHNITNMINSTKYRVGIALNTLDNVNPLKVLARGYAVATKGGMLLDDVPLSIDDEIKIETNKRIIKAKVLEIENEVRRKDK